MKTFAINASSNRKNGWHVLYMLAMSSMLAIGLCAVSRTAFAQSGNVYGNGQAQTYSTTEEAVVLQANIRSVAPSTTTQVAGSGIGAAIGGLIASRAGNNQPVATLIGATIGGILGNRVTDKVADNTAQEIVLKVTFPGTNQYRIVTVVQPAPFDPVVAGQPVFLINSAGTYRVVRRDVDMQSNPEPVRAVGVTL